MCDGDHQNSTEFPSDYLLQHVRARESRSCLECRCVVQGDLQRSLARHSQPERCCTTTIQTPNHPSCIRIAQRNPSRGPALHLAISTTAMCNNPANPHHLLARAASFAALRDASRRAKQVDLGLEEEVRDTLRAAALGIISSDSASERVSQGQPKTPPHVRF